MKRKQKNNNNDSHENRLQINLLLKSANSMTVFSNELNWFLKKYHYYTYRLPKLVVRTMQLSIGVLIQLFSSFYLKLIVCVGNLQFTTTTWTAIFVNQLIYSNLLLNKFSLRLSSDSILTWSQFNTIDSMWMLFTDFINFQLFSICLYINLIFCVNWIRFFDSTHTNSRNISSFFSFFFC